jgi:hypothetical protein
MGRAFELVTAFGTALAAAGEDLAAAAGNSLTVRNAREGSAIWLLQTWADVQTAGLYRIRSARMHDNVQGIRFDTTVGFPVPLLPWGIKQKLFPQDVLTLTIGAADTAGDIETAAMLIYYEDLPGTDARLMSAADVMARAVHIFTVENTLALGAAGGYSGEEAINAEFDLFKANVDYALVGYVVDAEAACVRWRGADSGNLGVGGPAEPDLREETAEWFLRLSRLYGLPLVPVFNAGNKDGILIDGAQDEVATDITVNSIFAELGAATAR